MQERCHDESEDMVPHNMFIVCTITHYYILILNFCGVYTYSFCTEYNLLGNHVGSIPNFTFTVLDSIMTSRYYLRRCYLRILFTQISLHVLTTKTRFLIYYDLQQLK